MAGLRRVLSLAACLAVAGLLAACSSPPAATRASPPPSGDTSGAAAASATASGPAAASAPADPYDPPPDSVEIVDPAVIATWSRPLTTVVVDDTFRDNRNGWKTFESDFGELGIVDGSYVLALPPGEAGGEEPRALDPRGDQYARLRVRIGVEASGMREVGFDCGFEDLPDGDQYYLFTLGADGASILRRPAGSPLARVAIAPDVTLVDGERNVLEGVCVRNGDEFRLGLSVNGSPLLAAVDHHPFVGTLPALWIAARSAGELQDDATASFQRYSLYGP